ncbi:hypothetical protein FHS18_000197 [Paenibacillus phyllosphaerae]|uniref:Uncharacterized protein n=1 Tax=Paenibacillus phyllosphaerae TaxID=274593 RepID=A0A7W5ASX9_9BACL|nr:hypothetical protein [Paenibacillus phyllosphaerae]MBB3108169.1 hypothetical protein [Paenibacillus phyllosphaerae]
MSDIGAAASRKRALELIELWMKEEEVRMDHEEKLEQGGTTVEDKE